MTTNHPKIIEVHDKGAVEGDSPYYRVILTDETEIAKFQSLVESKGLTMISNSVDAFDRAEKWLINL